jgi:lysophospholipase L1-like esterase
MVFIIIFLPVLYVLYKISRPPLKNPKAYLKGLLEQKQLYRENITLIGDSITHGNSSANYVRIIREIIKEKGLKYDIVNAGINGNTSSDVLARIEHIIKCDPKFATILIGTNDAKNSFNNAIKIKDDAKRSDKIEKDLNLYRENLILIIKQLTENTNSQIALISIPPIGEFVFSVNCLIISMRFSL